MASCHANNQPRRRRPRSVEGRSGGAAGTTCMQSRWRTDTVSSSNSELEQRLNKFINLGQGVLKSCANVRPLACEAGSRRKVQLFDRVLCLSVCLRAKFRKALMDTVFRVEQWGR